MSDIIIRKGNVELTVPQDQKDRYLALGYSVYDTKGNIIEEAISNDVDSLKCQINELKKVIEQKDAEIAKLKAKPTPKTEKPTKG